MKLKTPAEQPRTIPGLGTLTLKDEGSGSIDLSVITNLGLLTAFHEGDTAILRLATGVYVSLNTAGEVKILWLDGEIVPAQDSNADPVAGASEEITITDTGAKLSGPYHEVLNRYFQGTQLIDQRTSVRFSAQGSGSRLPDAMWPAAFRVLLGFDTKDSSVIYTLHGDSPAISVSIGIAWVTVDEIREYVENPALFVEKVVELLAS